MKHLSLFFAILTMAILSAAAQSNPRYAYVKKSNVNIRATASANGKVVGKAQDGDVYSVGQEKGEWVEVCYNAFDEEMGYINKRMVEVVEAYPFPKNMLNSTFSFDYNGAFGGLTFTGEGDTVTYNYVIKDKEMVKNGGSGFIDGGSGEVAYNEEHGLLFQPATWFCFREDPSGISTAIYDPSSGKLIYGGFLWTVDK